MFVLRRKCLISAMERRQKLQKNVDEVNSEAKSIAVINRDLHDTLTAATPGLKEILPVTMFIQPSVESIYIAPVHNNHREALPTQEMFSCLGSSIYDVHKKSGF